MSFIRPFSSFHKKANAKAHLMATHLYIPMLSLIRYLPKLQELDLSLSLVHPMFLSVQGMSTQWWLHVPVGTFLRMSCMNSRPEACQGLCSEIIPSNCFRHAGDWDLKCRLRGMPQNIVTSYFYIWKKSARVGGEYLGLAGWNKPSPWYRDATRGPHLSLLYSILFRAFWDGASRTEQLNEGEIVWPISIKRLILS